MTNEVERVVMSQEYVKYANDLHMKQQKEAHDINVKNAQIEALTCAHIQIHASICGSLITSALFAGLLVTHNQELSGCA